MIQYQINICCYVKAKQNIQFLFIFIQIRAEQQHSTTSHTTLYTMNKSRKKIHLSDEDDQVSIFDSEQQELSKQKQKNKFQEKKQKNDNKPLRKRIRAPSMKTREKKLSKDERSIMKQLMGKDEQHKTAQPNGITTRSQSDEKKEFLQQIMPQMQVKQQDTIIIPTNTPIRNNLDEQDRKLEQDDLTWLDLQVIGKPKRSYQTGNTAYYNQSDKPINNKPMYQYRQVNNWLPYSNTSNKHNYNFNPRRSQPINQYPQNYPYNSYKDPLLINNYNSQYTKNNTAQPQSKYTLSQPNYQPYQTYNPWNNINSEMYKGMYMNNNYSQYKNYESYENFNQNLPTHIIQDRTDTPADAYESAELDQSLFSDQLDKPQDIKVNLQQIEKLQTQIEEEGQNQITQEELKAKKKETNARRKAKLLEQIQKLKKQFKTLEDQSQSQDPEKKTTLKEIGSRVDLKLSTISNLFKEWKYEPNLTKTFEALTQKKVQPPKKQQKYQKSKTEGRITMIQQVLVQNPFLTQFEMAEVLRARDPVMNARIERSVVLRLLKMGGYKKKKIQLFSKDRNSPHNINLRYEYATLFNQYVKQQSNLFYYDQLVINQYFDKEAGWCKEEEDINFKPQKFINRSVVVVALLSQNGVCTWDVRFGNSTDYQYCKTISQLLKFVGQNLEKKVLIANPLPYRQPKYISEITQRRNWELLVLPTQAVYLNPLEAYFFETKELLKRRKIQSLEKLYEQVVQTLKECDKNNLGKKIISRVDMYIQKAIMKEPF